MKIAAIICCSLLFVSSASADERSDAEGAYMLCARQMAVRFEPSGESPESIASAAAWACLDQGTKAMNFLLHDPNSGTNPTELQESAKFVALGQVVGVRLCKKTKDCTYAHVP